MGLALWLWPDDEGGIRLRLGILSLADHVEYIANSGLRASAFIKAPESNFLRRYISL
jgi:hypothetical protein